MLSNIYVFLVSNEPLFLYIQLLLFGDNISNAKKSV